MTSLTIYGSANPATTLAAACDLWAATGGTSGNTSTKVGTSTLYKQLFAAGTSTNQTGVSSIPAPTDSNFHGWMWDVTTLEGQRIAAGTWTPTIHLLASTGTTIIPTVQWYKRSAAGGYTSIGSVAGSSIALTTSAQLLVFTPPSLALMDFATGDKLCMWLWVNQSAGGATNSTISVVEGTSSSTAGVASEAQTVTPGYAPTPVALSVTIPGAGTLTPTLTASTPVALSVTMAGQGIVAFATYKQTVLSKSPIRYYRLSEQSGTVATDLGSQAQNGTISATGVTLNQPGLLSDTSPSMLFTTATNGVITLPTTGLPTGAATWSVEAWVELAATFTSSLNNMILWFGTNATNEGVELYSWVTNGWSLDLNGATIVHTGVTPTASTVYHLVGTYDGTQASLYVNGVLAAGPTTVTASVVAGSATIGTWAGNTQYFGGNIQDVAIYSTTLSANQVATNYLSGLATLTTTTHLAVSLLGAGVLAPTLSVSGGGVSLSVTLAGSGLLTPTLLASLVLPSTTVAGVGSLTAALTENTSLTSTLAGTGTLSGTASVTTVLTSTISGVGLLSETFTLATALTSTLAGVGTLTPTLTTTGGVSLSVTIAAAGTFTPAAPTFKTALTSTIAGVGTLTSTLAANLTLAAVTIPGVGILSATASVTTALSQTLSGAGLLTPTVSLATRLSTTISGSGTLAGTLSTGNTVALSATIAGVGQLSGTLLLGTALTSTPSGVGTLTLSAWTLSTALTSTIAGAGTLTATLTTSNTVSLSATIAGVGTFTASAPTFKTALSITIAGGGQVAPTLISNLALASTTIAGVGLLSGTIARTVVLSVSLSGTSTLIGTWTVRTALFATCAAFGTLSGTMSLFNTLAQPGIAILVDSLYGQAGVSDQLVNQSGISDVSPGEATLSDQG